MSAPTLDGLTAVQLRDLSARALNAAAVQEQKAKDAEYVAFGNYRYSKKSKVLEYRVPYTNGEHVTSGWHGDTILSLIEKQLSGDEYAPNVIAFLSHLTTLRGNK